MQIQDFSFGSIRIEAHTSREGECELLADILCPPAALSNVLASLTVTDRISSVVEVNLDAQHSCPAS
jgi:hypothetical protein